MANNCWFSVLSVDVMLHIVRLTFTIIATQQISSGYIHQHKTTIPIRSGITTKSGFCT